MRQFSKLEIIGAAGSHMLTNATNVKNILHCAARCNHLGNLACNSYSLQEDTKTCYMGMFSDIVRPAEFERGLGTKYYTTAELQNGEPPMLFIFPGTNFNVNVYNTVDQSSRWSWAQTSQMARPSYGPPTSTLAGGIIGSRIVACAEKTGECFETWPGNRTWNPISSWLGPIRNWARSTTVNGGVLVVGGTTLNLTINGAVATTDYYDGSTWHSMVPLPINLTRTPGLVTISHTEVLVFGGATTPSGPGLVNTYKFNFAQPDLGWVPMADMKLQLITVVQGVARDPRTGRLKVFALGGLQSSGGRTNKTQIYDVADDEWKILAGIYPHDVITSTQGFQTSDGSFYIFSGRHSVKDIIKYNWEDEERQGFSKAGCTIMH